MSNGNFWDDLDKDDDSEYSSMQEVEDSNYYDVDEIGEEILEEIEEESAFDLDDREAAIIYNARLRLKQAELYELLINHNLFEGVDSDPRAIKNVQNELKEYIVERLEILMGMRKDKKQQVMPEEIEVSVESEFNDVEKDFLKQLAYKGTMGNSAKGIVAKKTQTIKPLTQTTPSGLRPLVKKEVLTEPTVNRAAPTKPLQKKEVVQKPKKTATQAKRTVIKKNGLATRKLSKGEAELLAKEELERDLAILKNNGKQWNKLSPEEKARRLANDNKVLRNKGKGKIPTPTQEQINMHYQMSSQNRINGSGKSQFNTVLATAIAAQKLKQGE